ncbi:MAG: TetR family transcriptional regulator [Roseiarcus sp.]|jgi:AcrR family transcriptional regulator
MNVARRTADETRQCILVAAWDLFRQVGFRKTTVADIAGALGMSSANIYRFFASKDALTEAICRNLLGALTEAARAAATGPGDARARLAALLLTLHGNLRDQMTNQKRVHEVVAVALEENWPAVHEFVQACEAIIAVVVAEGQASGEFGPGDPKTLAELVSAACAVIHHPTMIAQCAAMKPDMRAEAVVDFALRALANQNPPAALISPETAS